MELGSAKTLIAPCRGHRAAHRNQLILTCDPLTSGHKVICEMRRLVTSNADIITAKMFEQAGLDVLCFANVDIAGSVNKERVHSRCVRGRRKNASASICAVTW